MLTYINKNLPDEHTHIRVQTKQTHVYTDADLIYLFIYRYISRDMYIYIYRLDRLSCNHIHIGTKTNTHTLRPLSYKSAQISILH